ncbi:MAG: aminotransferase class IV [Proteobacteria bacterium]|nr:aminotransferase class IV [Pseudomonadota bacterium]MBU1612648.1 aminotransferase class IV [Pseudomonadota bacterium]
MIYWYRGELGEDRVALSLEGEAFRFGTGVFETLYYNGRTICHLDSHLRRLTAALVELDLAHAPLEAETFSRIIGEVLGKNGLERHPARINIYCFLDGEVIEPLVTARPHTPDPERVFRLQVCPERHVSTLSAHKTMNHMFHARALARATAEGFDSAVLLDMDYNLLEANSSALLFARSGRFITPATCYKLPSTALEAAARVLTIREEPLGLESLSRFDHAYILNSIIGMRPVTTIGRTDFPPDHSTCTKATAAILCEP